MGTDIACSSVSRAELYERVWKTPMRHLAKEYGFSDVGFAKLCRRHDIPTPPVGYWAKLAHGKAPSRPNLPASTTDSVIDLTREKPKGEVPIPLESTFFNLEIGRLAEEEIQGGPIIVAETLRSPHKAVLRTKAAMHVNSGYNREGKLIYPHGLREQPLLDIKVAKSSLERALRISDALLKACEARGYQIGEGKNRWEYGLQIVAFGQSFQLKIRELTKKSPRELTASEKEELLRDPDAYIYNRYVFTPTGAFQLDLCRQHLPAATLRDSKTRKVEDGLSQIMLAILQEVDDSRKRNAAIALEEAESREGERIRLEQEEERKRKSRRRKRRQAKIDAVLGAANAYQQSLILRDYIEAARETVLQRDGQIESGGRIDRWFRWVERIADSIDPLQRISAMSNHADERAAIDTGRQDTR